MKTLTQFWRVRPLGDATPWRKIDVITAPYASDAAETWAKVWYEGAGSPAQVEVVANDDWINVFRFELHSVWAIYAVGVTNEES